MSYEAWKRIAFSFLVIYFCAGMYFVDSYPFFNWSLFSIVPNQQISYTVSIDSFDGREYTPALPFSKTAFIFQAIGRSPTDYTGTIQGLGTAVAQNNTEAIAHFREELEPIFTGKEYQYNVVKVKYDPIRLWKTGENDEEIHLATFTNKL